MSSASARLRACALAGAAAAFISPANAQSTSQSTLPSVTVDAPRPRRDASVRPQRRAARSAPARAARGPAAPAQAAAGEGGGTRAALAVLSAQQALKEINNTPGGVALVPAEAYRNSTVANTIKDILDYVPGVFAQPKWGDDTRLSIRGSGLSRNFHLRGIQLYMDGIPINTSDGYGDFQEVDPTAYKYVEVYKGGNALQFGANSLGGAINFVTPTGRDPNPNGASFDFGAFNTRRLQVNAGGANGPWDGFATASTQASDGFRDHSFGSSNKLSANVGYQISPDVETRFYLNANEVRQRIPGSVDRTTALTSPTTAAAVNVANDWQRNIDTVRIANKTTIRLDDTQLEFGAFGVDRHLMHPIFQWLDYRYKDYGGFAKLTDDRVIGGFHNRLIAGVNILNGTIDAQQFVNVGGFKGAQTSSLRQTPENYSAFAENSFYFLPNVAFVAGTQYLFAVRDQHVNFSTNGDLNGRSSFSLWSPKTGLLWQVDPSWQVFGNVSRSAEVPSFGESVSPNFLNPSLPNIPFFSIKPQTATTYEVGTRMKRPDYAWEVTLYRSEIDNELLCLYSAFGNCNVTNANKTVHQGIEAGAGAAIFRDIFVSGAAPDKIWLNIAYTLNDFRFDNDPVFGNNQLPGAPRQFVRAELLYKHPTGLYAGPNLEWVPQAYFVDSANTLMTSAYAIWGFKAGFDNGGPVSGYVEARNIANKAYIASASIIDRANAASPLFEPGTGRAFYAGLRYRW
ncbi:TonB-dependent receptor [Bradyrhizobium viridifuturi]|jgi:iron complex outermembrane recepter protein|nr:MULTISPECIES: TonB-dependent receptor [Bradyrhizobium]PSO24889.1 TonB-dependent receptor [Bradyrhizobium sp. MOS004]QRI66956.1 TonB-dependent receptor [Bradyrhizobium sp. PSBB068]MBR1019590.1 TonB-dependent receptor [Bradyrhizobium viridifuturi]MBR1037444.1 TonB-dependent receptor [Bradyrhizobium viridifuturi]MBR1044634.1 TonB-dependent receptor [Bradyrhizobium viridifuturi]